jgi:hypothetical protein
MNFTIRSVAAAFALIIGTATATAALSASAAIPGPKKRGVSRGTTRLSLAQPLNAVELAASALDVE